MRGLNSVSDMIIKSIFVVIMLFSLAGCSSGNSQPAAQPTGTALLLPTATLPPTNTPTLTATLAPTLTAKPILNNTALPPTATITPVYIGTQAPLVRQEIGAGNYQQLAFVAQWGKGVIRDVAYTPDGESFVVGTPFGMAIYSAEEPESGSVWMPFSPPQYYDSLYFSEDGNYVRLVSRDFNQIRSFVDGTIVRNIINLPWFRTTQLQNSWGQIQFSSKNGNLQLTSSITRPEENWNIEYSLRQVTDLNTQTILYELADATIQVNFEDYNYPEGCDLYSFSMCGNVYDPNAMHPYRGGFSPTSDSFAILYRPPNLWNTNEFSVLRVYQSSDGELLHEIGDFDNPVETFDFSPDGKSLLVAYVSGEIELRNVFTNEVLFTSWDFNSTIIDVDYSFDHQFLIVTMEKSVEVWRAEDGSLMSRYPASAVAISPTNNHIAIGNSEGWLQVVDLDINHSLFNIQAHDDMILALTYSPNGNNLTSSSHDCTVRNWNAKTGGFLYTYAANWTVPYPEFDFVDSSRIFIYYMQYIPETDHLIGFGSWGRVVSWDVHTGRSEYIVEPEPLEYYQGMITLNPHFPEYFAVDYENEIFYINNTGFEIETGAPAGQYVPPEGVPEGCAAFGPETNDGQLLFTYGYDKRDGQICVLDPDDYHLIDTIEVVSAESTSYYLGVDWFFLTPDGEQLIVIVYPGVLYVYQIVP